MDLDCRLRASSAASGNQNQFCAQRNANLLPHLAQNEQILRICGVRSFRVHRKKATAELCSAVAFFGDPSGNRTQNSPRAHCALAEFTKNPSRAKHPRLAERGRYSFIGVLIPKGNSKRQVTPCVTCLLLVTHRGIEPRTP